MKIKVTIEVDVAELTEEYQEKTKREEFMREAVASSLDADGSAIFTNAKVTKYTEVRS